MNISKIKALLEKRRLVTKNIHIEMANVFVIGKEVNYYKNTHFVTGKIIDLSTFGEMVKVENIKTGKCYWIYLYQILLAY